MLESLLHTPRDRVSLVGLLQFTRLSAAEQRMSAAVGVPESFVARKAAGQTVKKVRKYTSSSTPCSVTDLWSVPVQVCLVLPAHPCSRSRSKFGSCVCVCEKLCESVQMLVVV